VVPPQAVGADHFRRANEYARYLEIAARYHPVRARCLHRALALHEWLRREGLPSDLRLGVRRDADELKAHAWVELAGRLVRDGPAEIAEFTPLERIDRRHPRWCDLVRDSGAEQPVGSSTTRVQWQ